MAANIAYLELRDVVLPVVGLMNTGAVNLRQIPLVLKVAWLDKHQ